MSSMFLKYCHATDTPASCTLVLNQTEKHVYYPGDKIQGTLIVSHQKDLIIIGFKVAIEGSALAKFKDADGVENRVDNFLSTFEYVHGGKVVASAMEKCRLVKAPTPHKFPFTLTLPGPDAELPSSFKGSFGLIHYQVVAYMHVEKDRFLKKAEKPIIVNSILDLTESALTPIIYEKSKGVDACASVLQFKLKVKLPKSGFVIGEEIPFELELENPNELEMNSLSVTLVHKIDFKAGNVGKILKSTMAMTATAEKKDLVTSTEMTWSDALKIPPRLMPTQLKTIIDTTYLFRVDVNSDTQGNLRAEIPITLGTSKAGGVTMLTPGGYSSKRSPLPYKK